VTSLQAFHLAEIVKENGGGNFAASVFLREDGFLVQFNLCFLDRLRRTGRLQRFCELLGEQFQEALKDAQEKVNDGRSDGITGVYVHNMSGVQKQR
jgi:hypothetical protein